MIQTAAPSVSSSIASPAGSPAGNGAPGSENGRFADILAGQPGQDKAAPPAGVTPQDPAEPADAPAELAPAQPIVAAALPLAGKILPDMLPDLSLSADQTVAGADAAEPGLAVPTLLTALRAMRIPQQMLSAAKTPAQAAAAATPAAPGSADDEKTDGSLLVGLAALGTASTTAPATAASPTDGANPNPAALPPMIEAQLLGRPLQGQAATSELAVQGATGKTDELALKLDPAQTNGKAASAMVFEADSARPTSGVRLRPMIDSEFAGKALANAATPGADASTLLASPLNADAAMQAPTAASALPQSARPHDFAALMDRLITARDAAQTGLPQSVQVAVNHAEFGQISLNFLHDKAGLAVSVGSADPDFARAIQAAIPAVAAAAATDSTRDSGQREGNQGSGSQHAFARGDASAASSDSGQRGQRNSQAATSDEAAPASNRSPTAREDVTPRQRGIFA